MLEHLNFSIMSDADLIGRTRWYIKFRWFYIMLLALPSGFSMYVSSGLSQPFKVLLAATAVAMILNGLFYVVSILLRTPAQYQVLAAAIPLLDILIVTYSLALIGNIQSHGIILYTIPIIMSAATLGRKGVYAATVVSLVLYNATLLSYYFPDFPLDGGIISVRSYVESPAIVSAGIFANTSLLAVLFTIDYIIRLLRQKERQALKTVDDLTRAQAVGKFGSWEANVSERTIAWSAEVYRLLGLSSDEDDLTFERYLEFVHQEDRQAVKAAAKRAIARPKRFRFDYRVLTTRGELRYFHAEGESLPDRSGRVVAAIGTVRDTTEERQLDQSKNEFVALASHQLRTPTTIVKQYLAMLLDGYAGDLTDKQRDFLKTAKDTNDRQIAIINNLLDVAQLESGKIHLAKTKTDVVALLASLVKEYQPQAETKRQSLSFRSRYTHFAYQVDAYYLRTVLENIVDNALRYSLPGTAVVVRLKNSAAGLSISVEDQGVGINEEDIPKLFKKFSRIEHPATFQEEGAGLGLYWSDKVVRLHGGTLQVSSRPGKGSTFTVVLPRGLNSTRSRRPPTVNKA